MKGKIFKIKNTEDELVLPITTTEAVYSEDGKTLNDELDTIENEKATRQEVDVERKRIDNINSSLDNNTNEIKNLKTHITGGNAMQEHSHINKTVLDKFSEVDNKLLFDGKPIESSNSGVNSGGSINTDFDTEISLPFTPLSDTKVQLRLALAHHSITSRTFRLVLLFIGE